MLALLYDPFRRSGFQSCETFFFGSVLFLAALGISSCCSMTSDCKAMCPTAPDSNDSTAGILEECIDIRGTSSWRIRFRLGATWCCGRVISDTGGTRNQNRGTSTMSAMSIHMATVAGAAPYRSQRSQKWNFHLHGVSFHASQVEAPQ